MNYKIITIQDHFVRNQVLVMRAQTEKYDSDLFNKVEIRAIFENGLSVKELLQIKTFKKPSEALKFIDSFGIKEAVQFLDSFKQINIIDYQLITSYFTNFKTLAWFFRLTTISLIHQLRITAPAEPGI